MFGHALTLKCGQGSGNEKKNKRNGPSLPCHVREIYCSLYQKDLERTCYDTKLEKSNTIKL